MARRICELAGRFQYRDMAILTRANMALGELQRALDEYRIPSLVLGGMTFYETREVRDLILLLTVLVNPRDEVALAGLLRSPLFGVSDEELLLLAQTAAVFMKVCGNDPRPTGKSSRNFERFETASARTNCCAGFWTIVITRAV